MTATASTGGRVRTADLFDLDELVRLLSAAAHTIASYLSHGHLLVLDRGDGRLGAACHLEIAVDHSTVDLLVVDPEIRDDGVRQRMIGVAQAMCEAYGSGQVTL